MLRPLTSLALRSSSGVIGPALLGRALRSLQHKPCRSASPGSSGAALVLSSFGILPATALAWPSGPSVEAAQSSGQQRTMWRASLSG